MLVLDKRRQFMPRRLRPISTRSSGGRGQYNHESRSDRLAGPSIFKMMPDEFFATTLAGERKYLGLETLDLGSQASPIKVLSSENGVRTGDRLRQIRQSQAILRNRVVLCWLQQTRRETDLEKSVPEGIAGPGVVRTLLGRRGTGCGATEHDPQSGKQNVWKHAHASSPAGPSGSGLYRLGMTTLSGCTEFGVVFHGHPNVSLLSQDVTAAGLLREGGLDGNAGNKREKSGGGKSEEWIVSL